MMTRKKRVRRWITIFALMVVSIAFVGCGFFAPTPTTSDVVGHWIGGLNPIAITKPALPAGTVHDIKINADGTCHFEGFIEYIPMTVASLLVYGGDAQWRLEKQKDSNWYVLITHMRGASRQEDKLQMIWTNKGWELSFEWDDPDMTNDLRFKK